MRAAREPWWVIGSAAAVLHGAVGVSANDVDVLLDADDARTLLPSLGVEPMPGGDHHLFRSEVFAVWREPPLAVEFMAGFSCRMAGEWKTIRPATRLAVHVRAATVFVPAREELRALMGGFGRPKDFERAAALAALGPT